MGERYFLTVSWAAEDAERMHEAVGVLSERLHIKLTTTDFIRRAVSREAEEVLRASQPNSARKAG